MEKFLLISTLLTPLVTANENFYCSQIDPGKYTICGDSGTIALVNQTMVYPALKFNLKGFSAITPYGSKHLKNPWFTFIHPKLENCNPKATELTPQSFDGLSLMEVLDLECVKFKVKPNLFKNFQSVTLLRLRTVEFEGLPQVFFAGFPNLDELHLYGLNLKIISPYMFSTINRKLRKLLIEDEGIFVEPKSFERLHNLDHLALRLSHLSHLISDIFDGLNRLRVLILGGSKITLLQGNIFKKVPHLESLFLTGNKISEIELEAFFGLNHLLELSLNDNELESLPAGVFHNLKNLKTLELGKNKLTSIPARLFHNLQNLETLSLQYNEIETVSLDTFYGCVQLSMLFLNNNKIKHIKPNVFRGLNLIELKLNHNDINVLEPDTFSGLYIESSLDLHDNNITVIKPQAFRNMKSIGELGHAKILLSSRIITEVDRKNWAVDDSIEKIDLFFYKG